MITSSDTTITRKVPWIADVPIIGQAFRYDSKATVRTELLIFLTPRVIRDDADDEMIKQVETERIHFLVDEAEAIHGPILSTRPPVLEECPPEGLPVAPLVPVPGSMRPGLGLPGTSMPPAIVPTLPGSPLVSPPQPGPTTPGMTQPGQMPVPSMPGPPPIPALPPAPAYPQAAPVLPPPAMPPAGAAESDQPGPLHRGERSFQRTVRRVGLAADDSGPHSGSARLASDLGGWQVDQPDAAR